MGYRFAFAATNGARQRYGDSAEDNKARVWPPPRRSAILAG